MSAESILREDDVVIVGTGPARAWRRQPACGARERTAAELPRVVSRRPSRIYNAIHLLNLLSRGRTPQQTPLALVSSRPTNYALAVKLAVNGIFLAGNIPGGEHGTHWAWCDGWRVGGRVGR